MRRIRKIFFLRLKYRLALFRIRRAYGKRKIVVAFSVSNISKWKCQSLYDLLSKSDKYKPVLLVYPSGEDLRCAPKIIQQKLKDIVSFFQSKEMNVVNIWDNDTQRCNIPISYQPDILFYQQPWDSPIFPFPAHFASRALTFYIPYYLMNNFDQDIEFGQLMHKQIFGYIVLNEEVANFFESKLDKRYYAGKCLGLGHTMIDLLTTKSTTSNKQYVIYAPHFSFPVEGKHRLLTYSSFLENGRLILEFAQQHSELNWVFKPHPLLYQELKATGVWSEEEVDAYYDAWKELGVYCNTSDYIEYFQDSIAMITDCGSFMTEYSCMDKPLIRLYYHKENLPPNPMLEQLYQTFYYANNNEELIALLSEILCERKDINRDTRHKEISKLGLNKSEAATNILNYLDTLLNK